jgi:hypothetical protein
MNEPTDRAVAELDAVDAALRSGAVEAADPAERELQELALALRADAPVADPGFAAELGERVEAGFPREPGRLRRRLAAGRDLIRRRPLPVLGAAASTLAAVAVAGVLLTGSGQKDENVIGASGAAQSAPRESIQRSPSAGGEAVPPPTDQDQGFSPSSPRRVQRSAQLTLAAPERRLDRAAADIQTVTERYRGYVLRSSLTTGKAGTTGGSFELRIPSPRLQDALRDLSGLGTVRSRTQTGDDVTGQFVSARDRLASLRAERRGLMRRLERAGDDSGAEELRRRLDANAAQINGVRGQLRGLRARTDYAAVSVALERKRSGAAAGGSSDPGSTGAALEDAADSLVGAVNLLVRALGFAIPLALLGALLWLAGRFARRRRREAALS